MLNCFENITFENMHLCNYKETTIGILNIETEARQIFEIQ